MSLIHPSPDIWVHQPKRIQVDEYRLYFENCIKRMEEKEKEEEEEEDKEEEYKMPSSIIVLYQYHDLLEKLWGWDRLVSFGPSVSFSDYYSYLEAYSRNTTVAKDLGLFDVAGICCMKEEELARKIREIDYIEMILPMTKSIIMSCLIHQCANAVIVTENCTSSAISKAALWCMTKEADLTLEFLKRGANPSNDCLVIRSSSIRICVLALMNCTLHSSDAAAASGAMLGIAKEAEMMCEWMCENNKLLDWDDEELSEALVDGVKMRWRTFDLMYYMLQESDAAGYGGGCNTDGAAKTYGGTISDILDSQYHNMKDCKGIEKQEKNDHFLGHLWGKLLPRSHVVEWSDYINYLAEYYGQNAVRFLADQNIGEWLLDPPPVRAVQIDTTTSSRVAAVVAYHCIKMEEKLISKWRQRVQCEPSNTFSISIIIESRLITERALKICSTKGEISVSSAIAFVCIAMEADLICELLARGADPYDHIIEESRAIRMCALGFWNLKGNQSNAFAGAMVGVAKEAKRLSDWMRGVNKIYKFSTFALSEPSELVDGCLIRTGTLNVMTRILCEFSFPSESTMV